MMDDDFIVNNCKTYPRAVNCNVFQTTIRSAGFLVAAVICPPPHEEPSQLPGACEPYIDWCVPGICNRPVFAVFDLSELC